MESTPHIVPAEYDHSLEPSKPKARRNIFELFRRREEDAVREQPDSQEAKSKKTPEKPTAKTEKLPPASERRRFAADVIMLARTDVERKRVAAPAQTLELNPEPPTVQPAQPELAQVPKTAEAPRVLELVPLPIAERAKEIGRGVLKMIGQVRSNVAAADRSEHVPQPTDLQPLEVADADVRAAMQELIAPIEEYEAAHSQPAARPETAAPAIPATEGGPLVATAEMSGGDAEPGLLERHKSPLVRTFEVAAAVASVTAREALETKERYAGRVRKIGLFALGAATVGGFAYTWRRMRKLKKEQLAQRKQHKRFEAEVRAAQTHEEQRLHQLEQTNVTRMTQPQRQQFVQEVSEFAHARATEIRTTARATEVIRPHTEAPQSNKPAAVQETVFTHRKFERPEKPHGSVFDVPRTTEKGNITERLGNIVSGTKRASHENSTGVGSSVAVPGAKLLGALTGSTPPKDPVLHVVASAVPKKYSQAWLLGTTLAVSLIVALLFLTGIL